MMNDYLQAIFTTFSWSWNYEIINLMYILKDVHKNNIFYYLLYVFLFLFIAIHTFTFKYHYLH